MKIKKFLMFFLIIMLAFAKTSQAIVTSDVYKQGIYNVSEANPFRATAKLVKPSTVTSLIIVDANGNQKFYNRFDNESEIVDLGPINNADIIAIIGKGEIAISFNK